MPTKNKKHKIILFGIIALFLSGYLCFYFFRYFSIARSYNLKLEKLRNSTDKIYFIYHYPKSENDNTINISKNNGNSSQAKLIYSASMSNLPKEIELFRPTVSPIGEVYEISGKSVKNFVSLIKLKPTITARAYSTMFSPVILLISEGKVLTFLAIHSHRNQRNYIFCDYIGKSNIQLTADSYHKLKNFL